MDWIAILTILGGNFVAMYFHTSEEELVGGGHGGHAAVGTGILAVWLFVISFVPVL